MGEDDTRAAMLGGVDDDLAEREARAGLVAFVAGDVEATRLVVEVSDPQRLPPGIGLGEASGKEVARGRQAIDLERGFGTLKSHAC